MDAVTATNKASKLNEPGENPGQQFICEARGINKSFGPVVALRDAQIKVEKGRTHALVGRNGAGKSTLVSVLTGIHAADSGEVLFSGVPAPREANPNKWQKHVACVYQHSTIISELTVAENLFINRQPTRSGLIDWKKLTQEAEQLLGHWGVSVNPNTKASMLTVEERQLVEIARSLSRGANFVILDEPTAQLDGLEIKRLFRKIEDLQRRDITFLFISHHLQEVYDICQDVTVFRDATHIVSSSVDQLPKNDLIAAMTGSATSTQLLDATHRQSKVSGKPLSQYMNATSKDFNQVNMSIHGGEIIGVTGSSSSGRTQIAEAMMGLSPIDEGQILVNDTPVRSSNIAHNLDLGVGCVPKSRHKQGLVLEQSIEENVSMSIFSRLGRWGFIDPKRKLAKAQLALKELDIHANDVAQQVENLSGGNQQKVVFGRALANNPDVLVLIDPTAGVDVKSKIALLDQAEKLRLENKGILLSSSEIDDLRICDRVHVMRHGKIVETFNAGWKESDLVKSIEGLDHE